MIDVAPSEPHFPRLAGLLEPDRHPFSVPGQDHGLLGETVFPDWWSRPPFVPPLPWPGQPVSSLPSSSLSLRLPACFPSHVVGAGSRSQSVGVEDSGPAGWPLA